ncbi:hypothetical protein KEM52_005409 [Ascosphaera acerosa]|nr:hypothetical protein KEM52_005409 [Ascosphaera acerosa]
MSTPSPGKQRAAVSAAAQACQSGDDHGDDYPGLGVLDILRFVVLAVLTSCGLSYVVTQQSFTWGYKLNLPRVANYFRSPVQLTHTELARYDGSDPRLPIYLAVNGTIFDVTAGKRMYGKGASYSLLAGAEANRAFVTGCFEEDRTPNLRGVEAMFIPIEDCEEDPDRDGCEAEKELTNAQKKVRREKEMREAKKHVARAIAGWYKFYDRSDKYFKVGTVVPDASAAEGGQDRTQPTLCAKAASQRPRRSQMKQDEAERERREREMAQITARGRAH